LLDAVEKGERVAVTRGGEVIAEISPARRKTGRDLRRSLEQRGSLLEDSDADDLLRTIDETRLLLQPYSGDAWAGD